MGDLFTEIFEEILDSLGEPAVREATLVDLRKPLKQLRKDYRGQTRPDFSTESARLAYTIAYHPYHAHMALKAFKRYSNYFDFSQERCSMTVFGAGPAPEVVALTKMLADSHPHVRHLVVDLVDIEPGWEQTRVLTLDQTIPRWWSGNLKVRHHSADLATERGVKRGAHLCADRNLVITQAFLSELEMGGGDPTIPRFVASPQNKYSTFLDRLVQSLGPRTLLLMSDLSANASRMSGLQVSIERWETTTPRAPPEFSVLYTWEDGLIERHVLKIMSFLLIGKASVMGDVRVWVNTESGVYHCQGTQYYGHTKAGAYMTQDEAQRGGYRAAAE